MRFALALLLTSAHADEPVDTLRMLPNEMFVPAVAVEVGATGTLDPARPIVLALEVDVRGVPTIYPGGYWASAAGAVRFGPMEGAEPVAFDARVTAWRRATQSRPIVAAQDGRVGTVSVGRDRELGTELSGLLRVFDWSAGVYLPANRPGNIEARVVVGARGLGVRWTRYAPEEQRPDFLGVALGGLSGQFVYGRKIATSTTLTGQVGGRADWAIGDAEGFSALTDTELWLGGVLGVGEHHALRITAGTRTAKDDAGWSRSVPALSTAWRVTW